MGYQFENEYETILTDDPEYSELVEKCREGVELLFDTIDWQDEELEALQAENEYLWMENCSRARAIDILEAANRELRVELHRLEKQIDGLRGT